MKKVFNIKQAHTFIQNGAKVLDCGVGDKGKVWIGFEEDLNFHNLMIRWLNKEFK